MNVMDGIQKMHKIYFILPLNIFIYKMEKKTFCQYKLLTLG